MTILFVSYQNVSIAYLAIDGKSLSSAIAARLLYALFVAHVVAYAVVLKIPTSHNLFEYYINVATEAACFAWNSSITLIIINWLYNTKSLAVSLITWCILFGFVMLLICFSNYVREVYLVMSAEQKQSILGFESSAFALALAYSITVIIAASIYRNASTNYIAGTDDVNSTTDDSTGRSSDWLFFFYCILITLLLLCTPYAKQYLHSIQSSHNVNNKNDWDDSLGTSDLDQSVLKNLSSPGKRIFRPIRQLWKYCMQWDEEKHTVRKSTVMLIQTSFAFLIGSAWNLWSVLSFQVCIPIQ